MNINKTKTMTISNKLIGINSSDISLTLLFVIMAIAAPTIFAHAPNNQLITGTIVNALLFYGAWRLGLLNALLIAVIPSTVALIQGLLPAPFALMIPYIIAANCLLVTIFFALKRSPLIGIATASMAKFGFLFLIATFFATKIGAGILFMFQWPQLVTALFGGMLAFALFRLRK